jgi:glyceraldehyde 3-phosphate dehydrogenase
MIPPLRVGINGFGRVGKSLFLQLMLGVEKWPGLQVVAVNSPRLEIGDLEKYLRYDSIHQHYDRNFAVRGCGDGVDADNFEFVYRGISRKIRLIRERDPSKIDWNVDLLFEATGAFLTQSAIEKHRVPYTIITAPAKDATIPTYICGVNENRYSGERIISAASCTTNCIAPLLKRVMEWYGGIVSASFTTIHATTASQSILDGAETNSKSARSSRSIFNNLIPATTGASQAIKAVIPELGAPGKIQGMAIRVPTNNVSVVDLVLHTEQPILLADLWTRIRDARSEIIHLEEDELVSSDFIGTTAPTIVDKSSALQLDPKSVKLLVWYDNEWSYSTQCIRLAQHIYQYKSRTDFYPFITENISFKNKNVLLRVDYNVPFSQKSDGSEKVITDDFRIRSTLPTLRRILKDKPRSIVIATHLGRPDPKKEGETRESMIDKYSTRFILDRLKEILRGDAEVRGDGIVFNFLPEGLGRGSLEKIREDGKKLFVTTLYEMDEYINVNEIHQVPRIYLLENLRFHPEETGFDGADQALIEKSEPYQVWNQLGEVFVNAAFGCMHRNHLSINGFKRNIPTYYDSLVEREVTALECLRGAGGERENSLVILGGAKIRDKLPLCEALKSRVNTIYLGGGIVNSYLYHPEDRKFIESLGNTAILMKDGLCGESPDSSHIQYHHIHHLMNPYVDSLQLCARSSDRANRVVDRSNRSYFFDIGGESLKQLYSLIDQHDIIFWNGTMGIAENPRFSAGSTALIKYLLQAIRDHPPKQLIIGGGDTAAFINKYLAESGGSIPQNLHICTGGGASIEYIIDGGLVGLHRSI